MTGWLVTFCVDWFSGARGRVGDLVVEPAADEETEATVDGVCC